MPMSSQQREHLTDWIIGCVKKGFATGPFDVNHNFGFKLHVIPIFAVAKPELNKWRTIAHGTHRNSGLLSLNDYIPPSETRITYVTLKEIVKMFVKAGPNAHAFAKDMKDAFYVVPIAKSEYPLMRIRWGGQTMGISGASTRVCQFTTDIWSFRGWC